ncbi:MAG: hypothetical protein ACE5J5_00940 [Candidatus Hydrothermarchaeales archaeon]
MAEEEEEKEIILESLDKDMDDWGEFYQKYKYILDTIPYSCLVIRKGNLKKQ